MGNGVFSEIDAALVLNLLHLKGHEHRKALCGQSAEGVDLPHTNGQGRIQAI